MANFKEARRALDQARTARGYYPVRNPNQGKGEGKFNNFRKGGGKFPGKPGDHSDKVCMRCGKKGHITRSCPQRPSASKARGRDGEGHYTGFVGFVQDVNETTEDEDSVDRANMGLNWEEGLDNVDDYHQDESDQVFVVESLTVANLLAATTMGQGFRNIDRGASYIVGEDTLQDLADHFLELDFDPSEEIEVDRRVHKQFAYGNNLTSASLGLSHLNAGICGKQVEVQAHMVEGATPFLLSA